MRDLGPRAARKPVEAVVLLRFNRESELLARVEAMGDPRSPQYHRFLTPAQFDERYAPTQADHARVVAALRAAGFTIEKAYPDRLQIDVSAATADVQRFFATRIHDFAQPGDGTHYAVVAPAVIPAALRSSVAEVDIDDLVEPDAKAAAAAPAAAPHAIPTLTPYPPTPSPPVSPGPGKPLTGPTYGPASTTGFVGWGPRGIADAFRFPVQDRYDGRGVTVGIVINPFPARSDIAGYLKMYRIGRTASILEKRIDGGPNPQASPGEATLDVETVAGLAPGARIIVYTVPNLKPKSIEDAYAQAVSDDVASVVSMSVGWCETNHPKYDRILEMHAVHGEALGMTFVVAAGDRGSSCGGASGQLFGVNAPASDPHFLAVSGNHSYLVNAASPTVWNTWTSGATCCAAGGGVSTQFAIPPYQNGIAGAASTTARNVPDIAFPAEDDEDFLNGKINFEEGTSWATPTSAALLAETVEVCGGRLGFVNPAVYFLYSHYGEGYAFVDVTRGTNAIFSFSGYDAAPGYDNASGVGMPFGIQFVAGMCPDRVGALSAR